MKIWAILGLAAGSLFVAVAGEAQAGTVALTGWTDGGPATSASDQLYGWFFDTSAGIDVTALGVWDYESDGLSIAHDVGIYRVSDSALMASVTIPSGTAGSLLNGFRYVDITSVFLAGGSYVIVMTMPEDNEDFQIIQATSPTTSSPVTYLKSAFDASSSLSYPTQDGSAFDEGMFGPNFQFTTAVPLPSAAWMGLATLGAFGLASLLRKRKLATIA